MRWVIEQELNRVSVAGCLGYDVLAEGRVTGNLIKKVSVAGCLGYDVLVGIPNQYENQ